MMVPTSNLMFTGHKDSVEWKKERKKLKQESEGELL